MALIHTDNIKLAGGLEAAKDTGIFCSIRLSAGFDNQDPLLSFFFDDILI